MTRPRRAISRQAPARRWVAAIALLAFFLQSLLIQTHIHQLIQPVAVKTTSLPAAPNPLKNQDPIDQCRLCQELVHAGAFVTPSATALVAGLTFVAAIFAPLPAFSGTPARAFAWQSRAPPRR
jgi:hypothetical protein